MTSSLQSPSLEIVVRMFGSLELEGHLSRLPFSRGEAGVLQSRVFGITRQFLQDARGRLSNGFKALSCSSLSHGFNHERGALKCLTKVMQGLTK